MTIYYSADLTYITRAGTQLQNHVEFIDFYDLNGYVKMFMEYLSDFDYTLLRCDMQRVAREVKDET